MNLLALLLALSTLSGPLFRFVLLELLAPFAPLTLLALLVLPALRSPLLVVRASLVALLPPRLGLGPTSLALRSHFALSPLLRALPSPLRLLGLLVLP